MTFSLFWLMMASRAMAVLPVLRSPMISSRWPRPMGVMASMALMPVCIGSRPGWPPGAARRVELDGPALGGNDRALAVERVAQGVDDAANNGVAYRHAQQPAGALDLVPFL